MKDIKDKEYILMKFILVKCQIRKQNSLGLITDLPSINNLVNENNL